MASVFSLVSSSNQKRVASKRHPHRGAVSCEGMECEKTSTLESSIHDRQMSAPNRSTLRPVVDHHLIVCGPGRKLIHT